MIMASPPQQRPGSYPHPLYLLWASCYFPLLHLSLAGRVHGQNSSCHRLLRVLGQVPGEHHQHLRRGLQCCPECHEEESAEAETQEGLPNLLAIHVNLIGLPHVLATHHRDCTVPCRLHPSQICPACEHLCGLQFPQDRAQGGRSSVSLVSQGAHNATGQGSHPPYHLTQEGTLLPQGFAASAWKNHSATVWQQKDLRNS